MNVMRVVVAAVCLAGLTLSGCMTAAVAPYQADITKERTFNRSFDAVWAAIVAAIAETNLTIATVEKDSGIIAIADSKYSEGDANEGKMGAVMGYPDRVIDRTAKLNIFATSLEPEKTKVRVNVKMLMIVQSGHGSAAIPFVHEQREAYSTGRIERIILDAIESRLQR